MRGDLAPWQQKPASASARQLGETGITLLARLGPLKAANTREEAQHE